MSILEKFSYLLLVAISGVSSRKASGHYTGDEDKTDGYIDTRSGRRVFTISGDMNTVCGGTRILLRGK